MKNMYVYYGSLALKDLRKAKRMTIEQLAALIPCSTRTVNRFEASNWTSNKQTAEKLAEIFSIPFQQLFLSVEQHLIEDLQSIAPAVTFGRPLPETTYYLLHVRRISWFDANIWGKTIWIEDYNRTHELRRLCELTDSAPMVLYNAGVTVITTEEEWKSFLLRATIGCTYKIIASKDCLRVCAPRTLYKYAVHRRALYTDKLSPDVILLGDYKNVPDVFSVHR